MRSTVPYGRIFLGAESKQENDATSAQTLVPNTEMGVSQSNPTTTILDPTRTEMSGIGSVYENPLVNPYPSAQFTRSLERAYVVAHDHWGTQGQGEILQRIYFPDAMASFSQLIGKLLTFKYMRADLRVRIKLNGTIGSAGALLYGAIPIAPLLS